MRSYSKSVSRDDVATIGWHHRWWHKCSKRSWWWPRINFHVYRRHRNLPRSYEAARSCYDHLAGRLGVALADALTARGFIILEPEGAQVTGRGMDFFDELGLEINLLPKGRRPFCRPCLDWSERRYHVAGRLGALLLGFCLDHRWLERRNDSRALQITELGARQFEDVFQIEHPPLAIV